MSQLILMRIFLVLRNLLTIFSEGLKGSPPRSLILWLLKPEAVWEEQQVPQSWGRWRPWALTFFILLVVVKPTALNQEATALQQSQLGQRLLLNSHASFPA